ncbi:MAG: HPF/RaiA family ribosome-associated protein [Polaromonas sp.]
MQLPLHLTFHGIERSSAIEQAVSQKVMHLERFYSGMMSCRVAVELLQKQPHQGRTFGVRIELTLPGHELVVNRVEHEDVYIALREAFDDMTRQIEDLARRQRGMEKEHPHALHGEVMRLDDEGGFGFIRTPDGDEYYFGRDHLANARFEQLRIGSPVQFIAQAGAQGPQAKRVSVGKHRFG